jgi:redox-sensitive bicupin YhaK (pirin superfamily)
MIIVRRTEERRHIQDRDRNTWMTFDRENKTDLLKNGFGSLQILNEEILSRDRALLFRPLNNMIIVSYVEKGVVVFHGPFGGSDLLEPGDFHQVNVTPGDVQYEFDAILSGDTHIFQSGFTPDPGLLEPKGRKKFFTHADRYGILRLIASPDGREASLPINRDVHMYSAIINQGNHMTHPVTFGRSGWLHLVKGNILLDQLELQPGDGAGFSGERSITFKAQTPSEILLFDVPEAVAMEAVQEPPKDQAFSRI